MKRRYLKGFIQVIVTALILAALVACGPPDTADETVTVEMWFGRENFVPHDQFEQFHADNPNIRVEWDVIPLEQAHTDFLRNHAAGSAPDVVQIFHEFTATMVAQGTLLDISDYLREWEQEDPEDFADIFDIAFDLTSYDGGTYGINVHSAPYFLGYRLDWLQEAGLDAPTTWEELIEASRVLQRDVLSGDQYAFAQPGGAHHPPFWMSSIYMSMGGEFTDTGLPIIDSPAGIALISFYQTLAREGLQDPEAASWASGDMRGAFMGDRAAFFPEAINIFATTQNELEYGTEWDVMLQPPREGGEADYKYNTFGWPFMVSSAAENPEAVMKVLRYVFDPEIVKGVAFSYQPANRSSVLTSDEYLEAHPYFPKLEEGFEAQMPYPTHLRSPERSDILNTMKQVAQTEVNRDPADIAAEFQERLNALDN